MAEIQDIIYCPSSLPKKTRELIDYLESVIKMAAYFSAVNFKVEWMVKASVLNQLTSALKPFSLPLG